MNDFNLKTTELVMTQMKLVTDAQKIVEDYYVQGDEFNSYDGVAFCQRFLRYVNDMDKLHDEYSNQIETYTLGEKYPQKAELDDGK